MLKKKTKEDFNNNLQNIFNLISISGHYKIVGSAALKGIYYNSDIDLNENDELDSYKKVYEKFKQIFEICKNNKDIFITDFKCGVDENNEPIRWSYKEIMNNSNKNKSFEDCLKQKSMIKLDIVYLLNGNFIEITEVYFLKIGNNTNYNENELNSEEIKKNLQNELKNLINEKQYFKALKRIFSILLMENKNNILQNKLINFFNSENGILYKANADLKILISVIENNFRKPDINDIKNNLQIIKQNLSIQTETHKNCSKIIDDICKIKNIIHMRIYIYKLSEYLQKVYNREAKTFLELNYH